MSDQNEDTGPEIEAEWIEENGALSESGRFGVTLGTTFSYRGGKDHWPKVWLEDSAQVLFAVQRLEDDTVVRLVDEDGQPITRMETGDELIERVRGVAREQIDLLIAEMKEDIDRRAAEDAAIRKATRTATTPEENQA